MRIPDSREPEASEFTDGCHHAQDHPCLMRLVEMQSLLGNDVEDILVSESTVKRHTRTAFRLKSFFCSCMKESPQRNGGTVPVPVPPEMPIDLTTQEFSTLAISGSS